MCAQTRMPRYDTRNDGAGPYVVFYCEKCDREFRSRPDIGRTVAQDVVGKSAGGLLRGIPIVGHAVADKVSDDRRYTHEMTQQQIEAHWAQVADRFRECPTCQMVCCPSDWDAQSGTCNEDSPRRGEIAQAQAEQAAGVLKGFASAFGLGAAVQGISQAARAAADQAARCPKDGTLAAPGTKFCPQCGSPMVQPVADLCPNCGADAKGAKFCPECGTKVEQAASGACPNCGAQVKGAKFCPECGAKVEQAAPKPTTCPSCGADAAGMKFCQKCGAKVG